MPRLDLEPNRDRVTALAALALVLVISFGSIIPPARAEGEAGALAHDERLALAFGRLPALWNPALSPDGSRMVMVAQPTQLDLPVAVVHDFGTGRSKIVLASQKDEFDLTRCRWANDERLLCSFAGIGEITRIRLGATRLVAIDADGSDMRVLLQRNLVNKGVFGQFQDRIVDWLPDDPTHVLVQMPGRGGTGLSRLDIGTSRTSLVKRPRDTVQTWITDGTGEPRLRRKWTRNEIEWEHRKPGERSWKTIWSEEPGEENDDFVPVGFGDDPNRLLAFRKLDGRRALVSEDLVGEGERVTLFARDDVDVSGVEMLGPHDRVVGVRWSTEVPHVKYFDPSLEGVDRAIRKALPGKSIVIVDESWNREVYLIFAYSDVDPGSYYRLDMKAHEMALVEASRPALRGQTLAPMEPITYAAADGTQVPGYVTRPVGAGEGPAPTVVLPHGGPSARDIWGFDWLAQFLAASGYVVFQPNYRGSGGYGQEWLGEGGFKAWRQVISDVDAGVQHLVDTGVSDPQRICGVGWSFGGWAVLLAALEHPDRYRCVVDIAGVTDPQELIEQYDGFLNEKWVAEMVSTNDDVLRAGSAVRRAAEFQAPVLIFHPDEDINVSVDHGRKLEKALRKAGRDVQYVEYEDDEHAIWRHASRIDMLTRIGRFLAEHLAPGEPVPAESGSTAGEPPASGRDGADEMARASQAPPSTP